MENRTSQKNFIYFRLIPRGLHAEFKEFFFALNDLFLS